jgi:hypothetical protein
MIRSSEDASEESIMESPLLTLPCLSARLELYPDHVTFRPIGSWAWIARLVEHNIPIKEIESIRLLESSRIVNGVMEIKQRNATPKSIFVIFAHEHSRQAVAFYETLDDLLTRKDVLSVIRNMESV